MYVKHVLTMCSGKKATLGGSAIINAAAAFLPSDSDWDFFDKGFEDGVWR
jgi:hypothetical protein